jgi:hypothetical protein
MDSKRVHTDRVVWLVRCYGVTIRKPKQKQALQIWQRERDRHERGNKILKRLRRTPIMPEPTKPVRHVVGQPIPKGF